MQHLHCTSSALLLPPNGTSNHIDGKSKTNNTPLSHMVFGDGNGNNNNNNGITPSDAHRRNSGVNSLGVGMVAVHGYATSGSISFGGPSGAIIQNGVSHRQIQRLSQLALIQNQQSNRVLPLIMMHEDDDGYLGGHYSFGIGGTPKVREDQETDLGSPKTASSVNHHHHRQLTKHEVKRQRSQHRRMHKKMIQACDVAPFNDDINFNMNINHPNQVDVLHLQDHNSKTLLEYAFNSEQASLRHKKSSGATSGININSKVLGYCNLSNRSQIGFRNSGGSIIQTANWSKDDKYHSKHPWLFGSLIHN